MIAVTLLQNVNRVALPLVSLRIPFALILFVISFSVNAQENNQNQKQNFVFQGFIASGSQVQTSYLELMSDRMRTELIGLQKFNVIQREKDMWKRIEEELKIQDFIDSKTAINLGNMLGAKFYLEGKLSTLKTDRKEEKSTSGQVTSVSYTATADAALNLVNLESGKYELSVYSTKTITSSSRQTAVEEAMNAVVKDLSFRLSKKFLLEANIISASNADAITINKGMEDGVKPQHSFAVVGDPAVKFKITEVSAKTAVGKLMEGDFKKLNIGTSVKETEVDTKNVVHVTSKSKDIIYIDAGKNLGIKKGDTYVSRSDKPIDIGSRIIYDKTATGALYVTDVDNDYSKGKIIKGYRNFKTGIVVYQPEEEIRPKIISLQAGYKMGFISPIKANSSHGTVEINNGLGSFDVNTNYNNNYEDIETVSVYTIGLTSQHLVKNITTALNADIYSMGGGELQNWIMDLEVTYNHTVVPETIYGIVGLAAGYGRLKQELPNGVVEEISDDKSSYLKAHSPYGSASAGLQVRIKRVSFIATASFDYLKFSKWKYDFVSNSKDDTKTVKVSNDIVPYPTVDLSGLYFRGMIRYQLSN
jgi:hypothetical protein